MPTIVFFSPKGGSGKTTAALLLALGLAELGLRVAVVDADPNKPLIRWRTLSAEHAEISVHAAPTAQDVGDALREARRYAPQWIIVDTEGSERSIVLLPPVQPDLVLTPLSGSLLDLHEALKAAELVKSFVRRSAKPIRHFALLSRVPAAIRPRMLRGVVSQLRAAELDILPTALIEKEALRALFAFGGGFGVLQANSVWSVAAARHNTASYVADVIEVVNGVAR